eukprot:COSAG06_NODE_4880_length_3886_cov_3.018748_2_plen_291_part_00
MRAGQGGRKKAAGAAACRGRDSNGSCEDESRRWEGWRERVLSRTSASHVSASLRHRQFLRRSTGFWKRRAPPAGARRAGGQCRAGLPKSMAGPTIKLTVGAGAKCSRWPLAVSQCLPARDWPGRSRHHHGVLSGGHLTVRQRHRYAASALQQLHVCLSGSLSLSLCLCVPLRCTTAWCRHLRRESWSSSPPPAICLRGHGHPVAAQPLGAWAARATPHAAPEILTASSRWCVQVRGSVLLPRAASARRRAAASVRRVLPSCRTDPPPAAAACAPPAPLPLPLPITSDCAR